MFGTAQGFATQYSSFSLVEPVGSETWSPEEYQFPFRAGPLHIVKTFKASRAFSPTSFRDFENFSVLPGFGILSRLQGLDPLYTGISL